MNLLSKELIPDQDGNVAIELFGGPADGAWIETETPTEAFFVNYEGRYRYEWDGEGELETLKYKENVELEQEWLLKNGIYEEE